MNDLLITKAKQARDNAYAPYSKFQVGAAVLMDSGTIYTGSNIENSSFSLTCCAERVAIFNAVSHGEVCFKKMVIIANTNKPISPCGACRQVMSEFFTDQTIIYLMNMDDQIKEVKIDELLPYSFHLN